MTSTFARTLVSLLLLVPMQARAQTPTDCVGEEAVPLECFMDVQCPQFSGYDPVRRSVVQIYGPDTWGTGVLINNASCTYGQDDADCGTPYLLTAAHLVTDPMWEPEITPNDIHSLETEFTFTFHFWTPFCGSGLNGYGYAIGGSTVIGWSIEKDLLLLRLDTSPPPEAAPYYVGWGASGFEEVAAISHPCGGPQKIAIADPTMIEYFPALGVDRLHVWSWDEGAVISGSSGGPLFADSGGLLGILSEQDVDACAGTQASAWFTALTSIIPFLGSVANGWTSHEAYDPNEYATVYDVVTNDEYYGSGDVVQITATQKVTLSNGFHADEGSNVRVIIVPSGP